MHMPVAHRIPAEAPAMASSVVAASNDNGCLKCGTTETSGKRSCCARGGAWFKKCGDVGDTKFDHTWIEGILACGGFANSVFAESSIAATMHRVQVVPHPANTTQLLSDVYRPTNINRSHSKLSASNSDCNNFDVVVQIVVCIYMLHLQTWIQCCCDLL